MIPSQRQSFEVSLGLKLLIRSYQEKTRLMRFSTKGRSIAVTVWLGCVGNSAKADDFPESLDLLIENHCVDCHDDFDQKGGLDLLPWSGIWRIPTSLNGG